MNQKLFELFNFCGDNNIDFIYETGENGLNQITHSFNGKKKEILIKICNLEDEKLDNMIEEKIKEFKSLIISQI
jgi:hypothetical protein